jgi:simple sugar transport system ATP-binding protein
MVGRDILLEVERETVPIHQNVLRMEGLCTDVLDHVTLNVRQGEVLGIVGVAGNGQNHLVEAVCGLLAPTSGELNILGKPWQEFFREKTWDANLSYVPEDRLGLATCRNLDLTDNFLLTTREGFTSGLFLDRDKARETADKLIRQFNVYPPDVDRAARQLSGGNLQKMVLAREFFRRPKLIVAEQPTQGLDISAIEEVWDTLLKAREEAGILLVTGDLSEALALSDRIAVMFAGKIMDVFPVSDTEKVRNIGPLMAGVDGDAAQ